MAVSLGEELNAATRPLHTTLNRLILSLFPSSVPPYTLSPRYYAHGMSHILPIYSTFEMCIHRTIASSIANSQPTSLIHQLYIPSLERRARLEADLSLLNQPRSPPNASSYQKQTYPLQLRSFVFHISTSTTAKPHFLVAYQWILYMALFSGGRYLRNQLRAANTQAWQLGTSPELEPDEPLQFWCFDGDQDGEDLKAALKARVLSLEAHLTPEERQEVVGEGVEIMKRMIAVVQEISTTVGAKGSNESEYELTTVGLLWVRMLLPVSMLKMLGSWGLELAKVGLGAVGRGAVA